MCPRFGAGPISIEFGLAVKVVGSMMYFAAEGLGEASPWLA
jgi:hypothetical protein